jgi:hypothetical protein
MIGRDLVGLQISQGIASVSKFSTSPSTKKYCFTKGQAAP